MSKSKSNLANVTEKSPITGGTVVHQPDMEIMDNPIHIVDVIVTGDVMPEFYSEDALTLVIVDNDYAHSMIRSLGTIDHKMFQSFMQDVVKLLRINYHIPIPNGDEYNGSVRLADFLQFNGFNVIRDISQTNNVINITVDLLTIPPNVTHVALWAQNAVYCKALKVLKDRGVRVTVLGTLSNGLQISSALRREADNFIDLAYSWKRFEKIC